MPQIIQRYAPTVDSNDEQAYTSDVLACVLACVAAWRAGELRAV
ncbi:MAG TPA: hypothetical protein VHZ51_31295 [Ktedonobacteraceae bacterium]|nr:hypothetical protein [Ktedonobacteraceae bacterium]